MDQYTKGVIATICAALVWSTGGLFVKLIELDAFTILFYRSLYAGLFFLVVFRKDALMLNRKVLLIALCYAPLLICFVTATKLTTAANAIFLQYISPVIVLILEPLFLKTKIKRYNVVTVLICTMGLSFFLFDSTGGLNRLGDAIALLSGLFSALLILSLKSSDKTQRIGGITLGNGFVVILTFPMFLQSASPTLNDHWMLAFLGVIQIGLGYLLFIYGQRWITAVESSLIAMLEPILNPVWVIIGYHEYPSIWALTGGLIILATLAIRIIWLGRKTQTENLQTE